MGIENENKKTAAVETQKTKRGKNFKVDSLPDKSGNDSVALELAYDANLNIPLPVNTTRTRNISLYRLKGQGFDPLLVGLYGVFKKAIDDSVGSGQTTLAVTNIVTYYREGLLTFSGFLQVLSGGLGRDVTWSDVNSNVIDQFVVYLAEGDLAFTSQKTRYDKIKALLKLCAKAGLLPHISEIKNLFPGNPYPNSNKKHKGQPPYSKPEFKRLAKAIRAEYKLVIQGSKPLTSYELGVCVLGVSLRAGMNLTPLLELPIDCLQPHPLKSDRMILVSFKRRGNSTHVTALRGSEEIAALKAVTFDLTGLIQLVIQRNQQVRNQHSDQNRLFVFESTKGSNKGDTSALSSGSLARACTKLIKKYSLVNDDNKPLKVNLAKLRKSFSNRMFELSGGDPLVAARLGNHDPKTANDHYWVPPPEAEVNHRTMIEQRTQDLIATDRKGGESPTPIAMCADTKNGQRAPKNGDHCAEILACFRCKSFVVTKDDLHRLFSFYWALVEDRQTTDTKSWKKHFRHIRQIIDENISPQFDKKFSAKEVQQIKQDAKANRHPFWTDLTMLRMAK
ncbi:hypothetical protein [Zhongshania sp. BJYM1]|uniref:hypothetical protein n=1 Tax=Zhongshania aquatica TaxID=2965069 RepID=UPI0022B32888|nr:hypothetical protein [Marortus sp. BJYM1]